MKQGTAWEALRDLLDVIRKVRNVKGGPEAGYKVNVTYRTTQKAVAVLEEFGKG